MSKSKITFKERADRVLSKRGYFFYKEMGEWYCITDETAEMGAKEYASTLAYSDGTYHDKEIAINSLNKEPVFQKKEPMEKLKDYPEGKEACCSQELIMSLKTIREAIFTLNDTMKRIEKRIDSMEGRPKKRKIDEDEWFEKDEEIELEDFKGYSSE